MLHEAVQTGSCKQLKDLELDIASKTGTNFVNNNNIDLYNVAYTPNILTLSWLGDVNNQGLNDLSSSFHATKINKEIFIRKLIQGTTMSYALWNFKSIVEKDNKVTVMNVYFQPETENVTRDYKILIFSGKGKVSLLSLTIFDSVYQKNKKYFDSILLNYKFEK